MSILKHLKVATAASHKSAEENNLAKYIIDHSITIKQYKELILNNYLIYYAVESYLNENKELLEVNIRRFVNFDKSSALKKDLDALAIDSHQHPYPKHDLPADPLALIGSLYVIEGSMLGGLLIAKHLKKCKNLKAYSDHNFFCGTPEKHLKRWKEFCSIIEKKTYTQQQMNTSIDAAKSVFSLFQ